MPVTIAPELLADLLMLAALLQVRVVVQRACERAVEGARGVDADEATEAAGRPARTSR